MADYLLQEIADKLLQETADGILLESSLEDQIYSRAVVSSLPSNDTDLATLYSTSEITDVATDDGTRVTLDGYDTQYVIHQFKVRNITGTTSDAITLHWNGQFNVAPSVKTVYLQIYNYNTSSWETVDTDSTSVKNTDFDLDAVISTTPANYYDANKYITARVYQAI